MEQIYTIPVNEAFEASAADHSCGCPMCALYARLEENELSLILGASMMEPDVRIETNKRGFCRTHYNKMFARKNRLGLALMLESHLAGISKGLAGGGLASVLDASAPAVKLLDSINDSCYICGRIEFHFAHMFETVVLLWQNDSEFVKKLAAQPYFCLPHYRRLLQCAKEGMPKKKYAAFYSAVSKVENAYAESLCGDVSWFCKKFDYRYQDEPWNNSKDAVERSIRFLTGEGDIKAQ